MSEPHWVHLVPAERELLAECHRYRNYLVLCGALLPTAELESSECEAGCERDVAYCLACVREAARLGDDDSRPWGYVISGCGCRRPLWPDGRVDDCVR